MPISSVGENLSIPPKIEVKPYDEKRWGVWVNSVLFGVSKHSFDCDFAAHKLAGMFENTVLVDLHPELRKKWI